ncbi:hypothetical protein NEDG_01148 [Nematocida displodere]|uniref:Uncharacterized protein n=1 Tax=Nematocida displodere TaxID=1805483 RepID=A0A177EDD8_9MICR|nr:hypothetical protein NEDG_01148 [Nematocida displodere]
MWNAEALCSKGFYGLRVEEIPKNEIKKLKQENDVEIVTEESVERVKESLNPELFAKAEGGLPGAYIRASNSRFMAYVTKGQFKFTCADYFFIFHELITAPEHICECFALRRKLRIGAKSLFYYVKKLSNIGLVRKIGTDSIEQLGTSVFPQKDVIEEFDAPKCFLKHVPIYKQVLDMILMGNSGIATQDLKEQLGMKSRQGLVILKKIINDYKDKIMVVTEFEGKLRRLRYISKAAYLKQKQETMSRLKQTVPMAEQESISTGVRTEVIEELVLKEGVIFCNKHFLQKLSTSLGVKHTIDKNTVIRTAETSPKIDILRLFIKYPNKTVTRHLFKAENISETSDDVINAVKKEGYSVFTLDTTKGTISYALDEPDAPTAPSDAKEAASSTGARYFKSVLVGMYEDMYVSMDNGYLSSKKERIQALFAFWKEESKPVLQTYQTIEEMPLSLFFSLFPITEKGVIREIEEFYRDTCQWRDITYKHFRETFTNMAGKTIFSKNYLKLLKQYVFEMTELKLIKKLPKTKPPTSTDGAAPEPSHSLDVFALVSAPPPTPATHAPGTSAYIPLPKREEILRQMCLSFTKYTQEHRAVGEAQNKALLLAVATDNVRRADISLPAKKELLSMFLKKEANRRTYPLLSPTKMNGISQHASSITLLHRSYASSEVAEIVPRIKEALQKEGKIEFLDAFTGTDFALLEYVILSLNGMSVVSLPKAVIRTNNICAAPILIRDEHKKRYKESISYSSVFSIVHPFKDPLTAHNNLYFNAFFLFRYLIHTGSSSITAILGKVPFISTFEIEEAAAAYPSVFTLSHQNQAPEHSILLLAQTYLGFSTKH